MSLRDFEAGVCCLRWRTIRWKNIYPPIVLLVKQLNKNSIMTSSSVHNTEQILDASHNFWTNLWLITLSEGWQVARIKAFSVDFGLSFYRRPLTPTANWPHSKHYHLHVCACVWKQLIRLLTQPQHRWSPPIQYKIFYYGYLVSQGRSRNEDYARG